MAEEKQLSPESIEFLRPEVLYEKLSTPRLLTGFYLENRLFEMEVYLMLLHRSGLPLPVSFQDWQSQARDSKLSDLERLYRRCHDDVLIELMVFLKIHWNMMLTELSKRFNLKPVGRAILMEQWQKAWVQRRRLKIDPDDTKQDGILKGLELLNDAKMSSLQEEEHQHFLELPPPAFPLESQMDELELAAWRALLQEMWVPSLKAAFSHVVPLVRGDMEATTSVVDNFLRQQERKFKRRKVIFQGKEKFPKGGPEWWRADWDLSEAAAAERRAVIRDETSASTSTREDIRTEDEPQRANLKETLRWATRAYEIATKRSGKKGALFIDGLKAGKTEVEAASAAGISDRTGRRIIETIRKTYPKKSPKKTAR